MDQFRNQSFCPELRQDSAIANLYEQSPLSSMVESVLGQGCVFRHPQAQIALRFPVAPRQPPPPEPHVDGFHTSLNGVAAGEIATFSGIVAVFLSDVPDEFAGNFTVWPGTHETFAEYYRNHAPQASLANGIPPVPLPPARQLRVKAGDAVLAHYLLAHTASINLSPWIRYAVFFRFQHLGHQAQRPKSLSDPWGEWQGMAAK